MAARDQRRFSPSNGGRRPLLPAIAAIPFTRIRRCRTNSRCQGEPTQMSSAESIPGRFAQLSPLKQAVLAIEELQARLTAAEQARNEPIAIIGMGCRFPGADNLASFWKLLETGSDAVREVPESRWKIDDYYDPNPDAPGKMSSRWGGFLDAIDQF